jgi:hypothetical protein
MTFLIVISRTGEAFLVPARLCLLRESGCSEMQFRSTSLPISTMTLMLSRFRRGASLPTRARMRLIISPARVLSLIMRWTDCLAASR